MFEQSILLPEHGRKKPFAFAASIFVEVSVVSLVLLIPLIYTERLGPGAIQAMQISPPLSKVEPIPVHDVQPARHQAKVWNPLIPSTHLRPVDQLLKDPIDEPTAPPPCPSCVSGAIPTNSVLSAIGGTQTAAPPPPKPKPEVKKPVEPPPPAAPIRVSKGTQEAMIIRRVIPVYPPLARAARVQGTVRLQGVISVDGRIEHLQVLSGHPLLVRAAVDAVKQWLYRPTLLSGTPVEVMAPIDVNFILSN